MNELKEITLPSGVILTITVPPFAVAKNLYQAVLEEAKALKISGEDEIDVNLFKDLFCVGLSSKKIDAALKECLKYSLYDNLKITDDLFENVKAREDYLTICMEVGKEAVLPFTKSLSVLFAKAKGMFTSTQK